VSSLTRGGHLAIDAPLITVRSQVRANKIAFYRIGYTLMAQRPGREIEDSQRLV
jgi:hypothetical protein